MVEKFDQIKEIGGYQEFEKYNGGMLHEDGIKLNCGRNCLAYLIETRNIKKLRLPYLICDSVINLCKKYSIDIDYYHVGLDFEGEDIDLSSDEWLYIVNYYGQIDEKKISEYKSDHQNIIIDNAQAYFVDPISGVDTLYTCRKFFGVADGAILYTDSRLKRKIEIDESYDHVLFLMGRYERTASEFYSMMVANNERFNNEPIKEMSKLTNNLLHSFDYESIKRKRTTNYEFLSNSFSNVNILKPKAIEGAFAYPLMIENAPRIREKLIEHKIYIPVLWPNVLDLPEDYIDYKMAKFILPIPCDQRYGIEEMQYIEKIVNSL